MCHSGACAGRDPNVSISGRQSQLPRATSGRWRPRPTGRSSGFPKHGCSGRETRRQHCSIRRQWRGGCRSCRGCGRWRGGAGAAAHRAAGAGGSCALHDRWAGTWGMWPVARYRCTGLCWAPRTDYDCQPPCHGPWVQSLCTPLTASSLHPLCTNTMRPRVARLMCPFFHLR